MARRDKRTALEQLADLQARVGEERHAERQVGERQRAAEAGLERARETYIAAVAAGREDGDERVALEQAEAEAHAPWRERVEAARRRIRAAEGEVDRFIVENFGRLSDEKRALDEAARQRFTAAAEELLEAAKHLEVEGSGWTRLLSATGRTPRIDRPVLNVDSLRSELRAMLRRGAPNPTPPSLQAHPDPVLRSVA